MPAQTPRHSVSVAAAVLDDQGRVLIAQRRDNGHWEPPGGVLELGESIPEGLRREVREETGLDVEPERLTGVYRPSTGRSETSFPASSTRCTPSDSSMHSTPSTAKLPPSANTTAFASCPPN